MSLSCGGRGPCCHVGYPHRHCDHCDVVIPTYACHHHYYGGWQPNFAGYYSGLNGYQGILNQMTQQSPLQAFNQLAAPEK